MRGKQAPKRKIRPDSRYNSALVTKLMNYIMERGKKSTAQMIVYGCFDELDERIKKGKIDEKLYPSSVAVFETAVKNVMPQVEVKSKRVGGGNYQVPMPVRGDRRFFLALHWLINAAKAKKGRPMAAKLAEELALAINNEGDAMKKRNDVHRMAEANKAFAHFARG